MGFTYFKRFRMEIDLKRTSLPEAELPERYSWIAWDPSLLERHASAKYASFRSEIDSKVFPCLGNYDGCRRLMQEISNRDSFLPGATWLISYMRPGNAAPVECGTIQGLAQPGGLGAVQNVGVAPDHRRLGLGRALVLKALAGFRDANLPRAYLEVTARNSPAVDLYRSLGFQLARTVYKVIEEEVHAY
jgi:ribosomal protein S18 acetylase RimI-like enzyme